MANPVEVLDRMGHPVLKQFTALGRRWHLMDFHFSHRRNEFATLTLECTAAGGELGKANVHEWHERVGHHSHLRERLLSALRQAPSRLAWAAVGLATGATAALPELARLGWGL